jgi:hypothetical protein
MLLPPIIFDNSHYLIHLGRYRPNTQSKDAPVDHIPIWQKTVDGITYNDAEFSKFFCVPLDMFLELVDLVKDHPVFQVDGKNQWRHLSPQLQMLVTLKYSGSTGNACSVQSVKEGLGISVVSVQTHVA